MAVDDYIGIHVVGRYQSQNIVNTMHYRITAQTVTEHQILQLFVAAWLADLEALWVARHIDTYELVGVKAFSKSGENKRPGISSVGSNGTVVGEEVPSLVCRVITLYTDSTNYRKRGRVMLSGTAVSMLNTADGAITPTEITAMADLVDALIDPITIDEEAFAPYLLPVGIIDGEPITAGLARKTPAAIRSRRVRGFSIG